MEHESETNDNPLNIELNLDKESSTDDVEYLEDYEIENEGD